MKTIIFLTLCMAVNCASTTVSPSNNTANSGYTLESAFHKLQKTHPETRRVEHIKGLKIWRNQVYKRIGHRELALDIYQGKRSSAQTQAAIILVHGGGWSSGNRAMCYALAERLASFGYITATASYRLSPEAPYPAAIHDVRDAIVWLRRNAQRYNIDSNFMVLAGGSAGGQIASLVGLSSNHPKLDKYASDEVNPGKVQAIINIDGLSSFVTKLALKHENDRPQPSPAGKWLGGSFEQVPKQWREASPVSHVKPNSPAMLFFKAKNPRFTAGIEELRKKLYLHQVTNELVTYNDAPHSFWLFQPWVKPTAKKIHQFLNNLTNTKN